MTTAARLLWGGVVLALVALAIVAGSLVRARSAAAEELRDANRRWSQLRQEAREQPIRINGLREARKDRLALRRECFVVVVIQIRAVRQLISQLPAQVRSPSELEVHSERARELLLDFRQLLSSCEGG